MGVKFIENKYDAKRIPGSMRFELFEDEERFINVMFDGEEMLMDGSDIMFQ